MEAQPDRAASSASPSTFHFSTDALPPNDRAGIFREVVGQHMLRLDFEPLPGEAMRVEGAGRALPGGLLATWYSSTPYRMGRTRQMLADGDDSLLFQWASAPRFGTHLGQEIALGAGDAAVFTCAETGTATAPSAFDMVALKIPRKAIGSSLRDANGCLARALPRASPALQMLLEYLSLLRQESCAATPELQRLAADHICDILAMALGATRDAAEVARRRGVRIARLEAIKKKIRENLEDGDLSVGDLAAYFRVTPRYVQMLFESEGTTFSEFLRGERLVRAYRMLSSPRHGEKRIVEIAYNCGFGDVSDFNRRFRARFGATPSDVRSGKR